MPESTSALRDLNNLTIDNVGSYVDGLAELPHNTPAEAIAAEKYAQGLADKIVDLQDANPGKYNELEKLYSAAIESRTQSGTRKIEAMHREVANAPESVRQAIGAGEGSPETHHVVNYGNHRTAVTLSLINQGKISPDTVVGEKIAIDGTKSPLTAGELSSQYQNGGLLTANRDSRNPWVNTDKVDEIVNNFDEKKFFDPSRDEGVGISVREVAKADVGSFNKYSDVISSSTGEPIKYYLLKNMSEPIKNADQLAAEFEKKVEDAVKLPPKERKAAIAKAREELQAGTKALTQAELKAEVSQDQAKDGADIEPAKKNPAANRTPLERPEFDADGMPIDHSADHRNSAGVATPPAPEAKAEPQKLSEVPQSEASKKPGRMPDIKPAPQSVYEATPVSPEYAPKPEEMTDQARNDARKDSRANRRNPNEAAPMAQSPHPSARTEEFNNKHEASKEQASSVARVRDNLMNYRAAAASNDPVEVVSARANLDMALEDARKNGLDVDSYKPQIDKIEQGYMSRSAQARAPQQTQPEAAPQPAPEAKAPQAAAAEVEPKPETVKATIVKEGQRGYRAPETGNGPVVDAEFTEEKAAPKPVETTKLKNAEVIQNGDARLANLQRTAIGGNGEYYNVTASDIKAAGFNNTQEFTEALNQQGVKKVVVDRSTGDITFPRNEQTQKVFKTAQQTATRQADAIDMDAPSRPAPKPQQPSAPDLPRSQALVVPESTPHALSTDVANPNALGHHTPDVKGKIASANNVKNKVMGAVGAAAGIYNGAKMIQEGLESGNNAKVAVGGLSTGTSLAGAAKMSAKAGLALSVVGGIANGVLSGVELGDKLRELKETDQQGFEEALKTASPKIYDQYKRDGNAESAISTASIREGAITGTNTVTGGLTLGLLDNVGQTLERQAEERVETMAQISRGENVIQNVGKLALDVTPIGQAKIAAEIVADSKPGRDTREALSAIDSGDKAATQAVIDRTGAGWMVDANSGKIATGVAVAAASTVGTVKDGVVDTVTTVGGIIADAPKNVIEAQVAQVKAGVAMAESAYAFHKNTGPKIDESKSAIGENQQVNLSAYQNLGIESLNLENKKVAEGMSRGEARVFATNPDNLRAEITAKRDGLDNELGFFGKAAGNVGLGSGKNLELAQAESALTELDTYQKHYVAPKQEEVTARVESDAKIAQEGIAKANEYRQQVAQQAQPAAEQAPAPAPVKAPEPIVLSEEQQMRIANLEKTRLKNMGIGENGQPSTDYKIDRGHSKGVKNEDTAAIQDSLVATGAAVYTDEKYTAAKPEDVKRDADGKVMIPREHRGENMGLITKTAIQDFQTKAGTQRTDGAFGEDEFNHAHVMMNRNGQVTNEKDVTATKNIINGVPEQQIAAQPPAAQTQQEAQVTPPATPAPTAATNAPAAQPALDPQAVAAGAAAGAVAGAGAAAVGSKTQNSSTVAQVAAEAAPAAPTVPEAKQPSRAERMSEARGEHKPYVETAEHAANNRGAAMSRVREQHEKAQQVASQPAPSPEAAQSAAIGAIAGGAAGAAIAGVGGKAISHAPKLDSLGMPDNSVKQFPKAHDPMVHPIADRSGIHEKEPSAEELQKLVKQNKEQLNSRQEALNGAKSQREMLNNQLLAGTDRDHPGTPLNAEQTAGIHQAVAVLDEGIAKNEKEVKDLRDKVSGFEKSLENLSKPETIIADQPQPAKPEIDSRQTVSTIKESVRELDKTIAKKEAVLGGLKEQEQHLRDQMSRGGEFAQGASVAVQSLAEPIEKTSKEVAGLRANREALSKTDEVITNHTVPKAVEREVASEKEKTPEKPKTTASVDLDDNTLNSSRVSRAVANLKGKPAETISQEVAEVKAERNAVARAEGRASNDDISMSQVQAPTIGKAAAQEVSIA